MAPRDPGSVKVNTNVTKDNEVNDLEAVKGILEVWELLEVQEAIERQGGKVIADEWDTDAPGDDITAHHVRPVEARRLYPPPIGPVSRHQTHTLLCSTGDGWVHRRVYHIVLQPVVCFFSVSKMISKPTCSTDRMACDIPKPL